MKTVALPLLKEKDGALLAAKAVTPAIMTVKGMQSCIEGGFFSISRDISKNLKSKAMEIIEMI